MTEFPTNLTIQIDPPITLESGPNKGPFTTLELAEPLTGEMRTANGQMRGGVNHETTYLRGIFLISFVTRRLGSPWPVAAIEKLPDGKFTEATNFLLGFSERASMAAMKEAMQRDRDRELSGAPPG
jgi:hypothetical protein